MRRKSENAGATRRKASRDSRRLNTMSSCSPVPDVMADSAVALSTRLALHYVIDRVAFVTVTFWFTAK